MLAGVHNRVRRWLFGRDLLVWYSADYRLPLPALEGRTGFETRRADFAMWFLLDRNVVGRNALRTPRRAGYHELARVHTPELLDSLGRPETLARIWTVDPADVRVDAVMHSVRLACGASIDAARELLSSHNPRSVGRRALNLLGGFHHAAPGVAGGFCPVNDIAVAVAAVRADGFRGRVAILDFDAHPPDGTAACLAKVGGDHWIGSISGSHWGPLPGVDETVLEDGAGDARYLAALDALLSRMPSAELAIVCAGGDVLKGDRLGQLGLTLRGCRERDLRVADALFRIPSLWLPSGGYSADAWRVLAGTGLALGMRSNAAIPANFDPLRARFSQIATSLAPEELGGRELNLDDVAADLGMRSRSGSLLLGFYSSEGLEHALERYGILGELRRLGYGPFRVELKHDGVGEGARLLDLPSGEPLIEAVVEKKRVAGGEMLYVHWLSLRNPRAHFSGDRPRLPGQDVPGLGLAREMTEILLRMAMRLGLEGLAFRPSAYHLAYRGKEALRFVDPARQGRFEALVDALDGLPLSEATQLVSDGKVLLDGAPYRWEPDEMVTWVEPRPEDRGAVLAEKARTRFSIA